MSRNLGTAWQNSICVVQVWGTMWIPTPNGENTYISWSLSLFSKSYHWPLAQPNTVVFAEPHDNPGWKTACPTWIFQIFKTHWKFQKPQWPQWNQWRKIIGVPSRHHRCFEKTPNSYHSRPLQSWGEGRWGLFGVHSRNLVIFVKLPILSGQAGPAVPPRSYYGEFFEIAYTAKKFHMNARKLPCICAPMT